MTWVCHDCEWAAGAETADAEQAALGHCEEHDHWLYDHPRADRLAPPRASMHASDAGGCYVDVLELSQAVEVARTFRHRHGRGAY